MGVIKGDTRSLDKGSCKNLSIPEAPPNRQTLNLKCGLPENRGVLLWGPCNKDSSILGSKFESPYFGSSP